MGTQTCPSQPFTHLHSGGAAFGCCPSLPPLGAGSGSRRAHYYALYGLFWTPHSSESVCGPSYGRCGSFSASAGSDSESSGPESYTPLLQTITIILFSLIRFSFICIGLDVVIKRHNRNPDVDLWLISELWKTPRDNIMEKPWEEPDSKRNHLLSDTWL